MSIEISKYVVLLCTPELYNQAKFILLLLYEFRAKGRDIRNYVMQIAMSHDPGFAGAGDLKSCCCLTDKSLCI